MEKKHLIITAVNLVEGGTLEILRQCLAEAVKLNKCGWRVTAIVNNASIVGIKGIEYIERPEIKSSWFKRIRFEYFECRAIAKLLKPDYWFSLHDMTPGLGRLAGKIPQAVYCHNAMCFYQMRWREIWFSPKLILFVKLYPFFYRLYLHRNVAVVVQQEWIRRQFIDRFDCRNVIVAHPTREGSNHISKVHSGYRFFYPSFARVFKNFETVLAAWELLSEDPLWDGELTLTIDGTSNRYGKWLVKRFGHLRNVNFIGQIPSEDVRALYKSSDCLIFASKLETWGLPISEAKEFGLFILAADLPYAHEAIGHYDGASFFPPEDYITLARLMGRFREDGLIDAAVEPLPVSQPFARDWCSLLQMLVRP